MNIEEIHINIDAKGKLILSLQGIKGESCLDITKELENLLGNEIEERKFSHEYYENDVHSDKNHLKTSK